MHAQRRGSICVLEVSSTTPCQGPAYSVIFARLPQIVSRHSFRVEGNFNETTSVEAAFEEVRDAPCPRPCPGYGTRIDCDLARRGWPADGGGLYIMYNVGRWQPRRWPRVDVLWYVPAFPTAAR